MSIDGQAFQYAHGPVRTFSMQWPGTSGQAAFEFDSPAGPIAGPAFQGPWALFRLLDHARVQALSGSRYRATFTAGGKSMGVIVAAASIRNPFGKDVAAGFRCTQ